MLGILHLVNALLVDYHPSCVLMPCKISINNRLQDLPGCLEIRTKILNERS